MQVPNSQFNINPIEKHIHKSYTWRIKHITKVDKKGGNLEDLSVWETLSLISSCTSESVLLISLDFCFFIVPRKE